MPMQKMAKSLTKNAKKGRNLDVKSVQKNMVHNGELEEKSSKKKNGKILLPSNILKGLAKTEDSDTVESAKEEFEEDSGSDVAEDGKPKESPEDEQSDDEDMQLREAQSQSDDEEDSPPLKNSLGKIKPILSKSIPSAKVVVVWNLAGKFKQIDFVEIFGKYGIIENIEPKYKKAEKGKTCGSVQIAFRTAEAAKAALAANRTAELNDRILMVAMRDLTKAEKRQQSYNEQRQKFDDAATRTICVKNIKSDTTKELLQQHFGQCGSITRVTLKTDNHYAFVEFDETTAIEAARKLHNTVLNGRTINVFARETEQPKNIKRHKHTIILKNIENLANMSDDKLRSIFSKCGEIEEIEILCKKIVLAFITFKNEEAATKAMQMNGKKVADLQLEIDAYYGTPKTTIFVQNVKPGVTKEEMQELFEKAGEVESVFVNCGFAIVRFKRSESYCKSFLLNESKLHGQPIFVEPYSDKKPRLGAHRTSHFAGKKRSFPNVSKGGLNKITKK